MSSPIVSFEVCVFALYIFAFAFDGERILVQGILKKQVLENSARWFLIPAVPCLLYKNHCADIFSSLCKNRLQESCGNLFRFAFGDDKNFVHSSNWIVTI